MFCPNCGTQNDSAASPCKKCGFKLSGVSAPKFKGTMMMNSEQSVQDLIDEHKRKRAAEDPAADPAEPPPPERTASAPAPSPSEAPPAASRAAQKGVVLQPPRAASSKRRMGGTMLGVAPQAGGIIPPTPIPSPTPVSPDVAPAPSPPIARGAAPEPVPASPELVSGPLRPDALAGTVAMPMVQPDAPVPGRTRAFDATPPPGRTQALDATPPPGRTQTLDATPPPVATADPQPAAPPEAWHAEPAAARSALTAQDSLPPLQELSDSSPVPRRVRPFEIFLIVATCGLYGLVMLMRQRKNRPGNTAHP